MSEIVIGARKTDPVRDAILSIAGSISAASEKRPSPVDIGDVAALRRADGDSVPPAAFWKLMSKFVPDASEVMEARWLVVLKGMAIMSPHIHDPRVPLGRALRESGFATADRPARLNRLLEADGDLLPEVWLSACRYLSAKGQSFDWTRGAWLVLGEADTSRRAIARDFYRHTQS